MPPVYKSRLRADIKAYLVWAAGMLVTGLVTFPNHYCFRTYGDLAYLTQLLYYHGQGYLFVPSISSICMIGEDAPCGSPHFSPVLILLLPFFWVGGVWGILVGQWLAIGLGAWGIYQYAQYKLRDKGAACWSQIHFWGMWGIYSALGFDAHEVVIGAMLVPWVFYFWERRMWWALGLSWLGLIGSKENLALWGAWMAVIAGFWLYRGEKKAAQVGLVLAFVALGWLGLAHLGYTWASQKSSVGPSVSRVEMLYSYLAADNPLNALRYGHSAEFNLKKVIANLLGRPQLVWTFLLEGHVPEGMGAKAELHWSVLWSGGWAFFIVPVGLVLLIPVYLYKLLASDLQLWGTLYHYSLEYAVMLPLVVVWAAGRLPYRPALVLGLGAFAAHVLNLSLLSGRYSEWYTPEQHRWYSPAHYRSSFNYQKVHEGLRLIPPEAPVSAASRLLSHIPPREKYYHFPVVRDAQYLALLRGDPNPWPIRPGEPYQQVLDTLARSPYWQKIYDRDSLLIFRRREP
ncbi:MAG: DUF2079 domain-containing protein [Bacteroidia bacterium]|nr:DUF2079 domain-containing protein [Bacteroidia bacterium]MDW8088201.1 DUF2079 domain-containing protein [Bacteroidia bacterium]